MFKRGRRLFSTAAILMIVTAALHTAGNAGGERPEMAKIFAEMRDFHFPMGFGMNPSMENIFSDLVFTMSVTFTAIGILNLLIAASAEVSDRLLRRIAWVNALWVGAFLILCWINHIPPPLICAVVIELLLIADLLIPSRRSIAAAT